MAYKNPEDARAWARKYYLTHKEQRRAINRRWYEKNREHRNFTNRAWYHRNNERARARAREWRRVNIDRVKTREYERREKDRYDVISHYSHGEICCACCGESTYDFLTIDDIHSKHHKYFNKHHTASTWYHWLIKNKFPEGFQVLCYNCNCGRSKRKNLGICPHTIQKQHKIRINAYLPPK